MYSQVRKNYHAVNFSIQYSIEQWERNPVGYVPPQAVLFTDDFNGANDTNALKQRGYFIYRNGTGPPGSTPIWFQGIPAGPGSFTFNAFNGPPDGYVASDFACTQGVNIIDNWLVLPPLNLSVGDTFSFYIRAAEDPYFVDSVKVMYNPAGDSLPSSPSWIELDYFYVNEVDWERRTYTTPIASGMGRWAIRYFIIDGGPSGANSDYIGIDQIDVIPASPVSIATAPVHYRMLLYPNPASHLLYICFNGMKHPDARLTIRTMQGTIVFSELYKASANEWQTMDLTNMASGLYLVELNNGSQSYFSKLIKSTREP
jgi:hypothetical protein